MPEASSNIDTIEVLIVDNDDEYIELFKLILDQGIDDHLTCHLTISYNTEDGLKAYKEGAPDIVIVGMHTPGDGGVEFTKKVRSLKRRKYTSIIITSASDGPSEVVASFNAGADDFCAKKNAWIELPARIKSGLRIKGMQESLLESNYRLRKANKKLQTLSESDELTGLNNMRYFKKRLTQEFSRAQRYENPISILIFDLDYFKNVNDSSNHLVGSHVLTEVGTILKETIRNHDIGARFGGDEYVAILTQTDEKGAEIVAKRLLAKISSTTYKLENIEARVTASVGISTYIPGVRNFGTGTELLKAADKNLYRAKENGRACYASDSIISPALKDYSDTSNRILISESEDDSPPVEESFFDESESPIEEVSSKKRRVS